MRILPCIAIVVLFLPLLALAQTKAPKAKRAAPPKFTRSEPFFEDAFKEALVGQRPGDLSKAGPLVVSSSNVIANSATASSTSAPSGSGWSRLISATTIEDSIKSLKLQIDKEITTPGD